MNKRTLTALAVSSLVATAVAVPVAYADDNDRNDTTMEQRAAASESAIKDAWLDGKLETALLFNEHLNSFDIDTDVKNGVAVLRGAVESDIDRDLADQIAQSIDGVTDVKNKLVVDTQKAKASHDDSNDDAKSRRGFKQSVANATLTARIKSELLVNSNTAGLSINVDSSDGQVTLSGDVDSEQEKELAEKIAENAQGARSVENRLKVSSTS